jgi:hypothetical protein
MTTQQLVLSLVLATMVFSVALELRVVDFTRVAQTPRAVIGGLVPQFVLLPGRDLARYPGPRPRAQRRGGDAPGRRLPGRLAQQRHHPLRPRQHRALGQHLGGRRGHGARAHAAQLRLDDGGQPGHRGLDALALDRRLRHLVEPAALLALPMALGLTVHHRGRSSPNDQEAPRHLQPAGAARLHRGRLVAQRALLDARILPSSAS